MNKFSLLLICFITSSLQAQNALDFDGSNDAVNCGTDTAFDIGGKSFSMEAWINASAWTKQVFEGSIINKENNSTNGGYMLRAGDAGRLGFAIGEATSSSWYEINTGNILSLNTWYHVAATYDGVKMRLYLNGNPIDSLSTSVNIGITNTIPLTIGYHLTYGRYWSGTIDEVRLWNTVRTQAEIKANMNAEFCSVTSGLRAYYKFDEGKAGGNNASIKTAKDYSIHNKTATLTNFALSGSTSNWVKGAGLSQSTVYSYDTLRNCGPFIWTPHGRFYTVSTTNSQVFSSSTGCDSTVITQIYIKDISYTNIAVAVCDSFVSPTKKVYKVTGTYKETFTAANGCDSVVTFDVKVGTDLLVIDTSVCYAYKGPSGKNTYTTSGTYYETLKSYIGCDSNIKINLVVKGATTASTTYFTCDSIKSPSGKWLQANKTYLDTIMNAQHCDSIITIKVNSWVTRDTIYPKTCSFYVGPSKKFYTVSGLYLDTTTNKNNCHHITHINLTVAKPSADSSIHLVGCRNVTTSDGKHVYTVSGIYHDTLINHLGCDSFVTMRVDVFNVNTDVTVVDSICTAKTVGGTVQWLNCNTNYSVIAGETNKYFIAKVNGSYAAQIAENNCLDTSACLTVLHLGITPLINSFNIYPNPSNGQITIELKDNASKSKIEIVGVDGKSIQTYNELLEANIQINLKPGVYFIHVSNAQGMATKKVMVY